MTLQWRRPDAYHIVSTCGRFTVARKTVLGLDWYIAYRRHLHRDGERSDELGAISVPPRATDEDRQAAIREMQGLCEAAART